jgi:hypothetical protein
MKSAECLQSRVCGTEFIVVRASVSLDDRCANGYPMLPMYQPRAPFARRPATLPSSLSLVPRYRRGWCLGGSGDPLIELDRDLVADVLTEGAEQIRLDR